MKQRTILSEYAHIHCATCRQPVRRATIIDGKAYCAVHAAELNGSARSAPFVTALRSWFGHADGVDVPVK